MSILANSSRDRLRVGRRWTVGGLEAEKEGKAGEDVDTGMDGRVNGRASAAIETGG
jgi:hypothetical protein